MPKPALLTRTSTERPRAAIAASTGAWPSNLARSAGMTKASIPCAAVSSSASARQPVLPARDQGQIEAAPA
jgi:hypothetical protein